MRHAVATYAAVRSDLVRLSWRADASPRLSALPSERSLIQPEAQTALAQAGANVYVAQARFDEIIICALTGVHIARAVKPGTVVQPDKELMALAPAGETQMVVPVDEKTARN